MNYSAEGAATGQTPAQAPHSTQASASITYLPSPSEIASTGHSLAQAPQLIQSSLIIYAIIKHLRKFSGIKPLYLYSIIFAEKINSFLLAYTYIFYENPHIIKVYSFFAEHKSRPETVQNIGEKVILLQPMKNISIPHMNIINVHISISERDFFTFLKPFTSTEPSIRTSAINEGIPLVAAVYRYSL